MKYSDEPDNAVEASRAMHGARFCACTYTVDDQEAIFDVTVAAVTAWEAGLKTDALFFRRRAKSRRSR